MSQPEINIRILDLNGPRMAQTERSLRRHLKQHAVEARITCVGCGLEIARQGFTNATPALLMNQYTITEGKEITEEAIETFASNSSSGSKSNKPVPASGLLGDRREGVGKGEAYTFFLPQVRRRGSPCPSRNSVRIESVQRVP
ncbi:hypothetical protein [Bilophila wadsworthia]|uniref:hypothetical protein n=3 Tax=Bilophila TaxID=35832 RepID=UPI0024300A4E|nr:hypothetical protein [Bilophila wadsworthia]